ncbi:MAG TPA: J domain-containing protein [Geminicoccaceae bacterium]|nr:J domain-containing protein [Geminicoccaceae bacterium]
MRDPYEVLGLARDASQDDIAKAYRRLAKESHPDLHPGDAAAEERFKELSLAREILSDPEKRARYDRGEIDASGAERPQREFYRGYAEGPAGTRYSQTEVFGDGADLGDIFADLFGGGAREGRTIRLRGPDVSYTLEVDFLDAARGARRTITTPDGRTLQVTIPVGVRDRQTLRLKGMGGPGIGGGESGDAYIEIHIRPHPVFRRKDGDIHVELPVTPAEAVLGGRVPVPTVTGEVTLTIPPGSNTGTTLRLRGKGIPARGGEPAGDQYVRLKVVLPRAPDDELKGFLQEWAAKHAWDPREELMREARR